MKKYLVIIAAALTVCLTAVYADPIPDAIQPAVHRAYATALVEKAQAIRAAVDAKEERARELDSELVTAKERDSVWAIIGPKLDYLLEAALNQVVTIDSVYATWEAEQVQPGPEVAE